MSGVSTKMSQCGCLCSAKRDLDCVPLAICAVMALDGRCNATTYNMDFQRNTQSEINIIL